MLLFCYYRQRLRRNNPQKMLGFAPKEAQKGRDMFPFLPYLPVGSAVGTAIAGAINDVTEDIKTVATAMFGILSLIGGIVFVVVLFMELIHYRKTQELDWMRLVLILVAIVICAGGATLAFTIGNAA